MIELRFALRDVLAVADHAIAAPAHKPSFADTVDGTAPTPALWFVGDDGLYLMSNGLPGQPDPDGGDRLQVVHADGYTTAMSKHAVADEIGGDDFCEPLPLLAPQDDGRTLHVQLTDGVAAGLDLLIIRLDPTSMQIFFADSQEATR